MSTCLEAVMMSWIFKHTCFLCSAPLSVTPIACKRNIIFIRALIRGSRFSDSFRQGGEKLDMDGEQLDISPQDKRVIEERLKHRTKLKAQWQKLVSNPHNKAEGYVFDPAMQRFMSMRVTHYETFRPTPGNFLWGVASTVMPILLFGYLMHWDRMRKEAKFSTGQVAYKDRMWKTYR